MSQTAACSQLQLLALVQQVWHVHVYKWLLRSQQSMCVVTSNSTRSSQAHSSCTIRVHTLHQAYCDQMGSTMTECRANCPLRHFLSHKRPFLLQGTLTQDTACSPCKGECQGPDFRKTVRYMASGDVITISHGKGTQVPTR